MAKGIKVKINRQAWGQQVMASQQMNAFLTRLGSQVAAMVPGGVVNVSSSRVIAGGRRSRAKISTTIPLSTEADTGQALAALRSVVGSAHVPKNSRAAKARAQKREERRR